MCFGVKHLLFATMLSAMLLCVPSLTSCAGSGATARDEHEYSHSDYREKFIEDRDRCRRMGHTFVVSGHGARIDRDGYPDAHVSYYCLRSYSGR